MRFGIVRPSEGESEESGSESESNGEEGKGRNDYPTLEKSLGYSFKDHDWLERALTHRSLHSKGEKNDYERLEFLGDAVLDLAVAELLLVEHPKAREGELSKMRAALVNTSSLAEIAKTLNLGEYIRLSRGEMANGGAQRPSILADVFEAVMGALYKEAGFETAKDRIEAFFGQRLKNVVPRDPKTELQEQLHAAGSSAPEYLLERVEGPEHAPTFVSVVKVDGQVVGRGSGTTKKASQQAAAAEAMEYLSADDEINSQFIQKLEEPAEEDE